MKLSKKEIEMESWIRELKGILGSNNTIYTSLKHVSSSGMMRHISVHHIRKNEMLDISWYVARILDYKRADNGGLKVSGCGMDMGFHIIHNLGYALYPKGFKCLGKKCPSNDHFNDFKCDRVKGKHHHKSGGYYFKQKWI